MLAYLNGTIADILPEGVVIDVGGVGYYLAVTGHTLQNISQTGEKVKLYTHMSVREDGMTLFGFYDKEELSMFRMLLSVNGIGPKAALSILSFFSPSELRFAILAEDAKTISKAPGVGAKTAKRIILDCKDKVDFEEVMERVSGNEDTTDAASLAQNQKGVDTNAKNEAVLALEALGYSPSESLSAVNKVEITPADDTEAILKKALKQLF